MTQKYLGMLLGFPEKSADVRLAQYETGARTPKADLTVSLARVFDVSPQALAVPDIDSCIGLMHTLFTLEDRYGLKIDEADGEVCLKVDVRKNKDAAELHKMLCAWRQVSAMTSMPVEDSQGTMPASVPAACAWMPKALGMDGPVTSASRIPTL